MKKLTILIIVILCTLSCNQRNTEYVSQSFTSGKWHIVDYHKGSKEKQSLYTTFYFTFLKDNHITAKSDNESYIGEWLIFKSDVTDDAPLTDIDFKITFKENALSKLNGDWKIIKRTNNYLSLIQINEVAGIHLIFEKS